MREQEDERPEDGEYSRQDSRCCSGWGPKTREGVKSAVILHFKRITPVAGLGHGERNTIRQHWEQGDLAAWTGMSGKQGSWWILGLCVMQYRTWKICMKEAIFGPSNWNNCDLLRWEDLEQNWKWSWRLICHLSPFTFPCLKYVISYLFLCFCSFPQLNCPPSVKHFWVPTEVSLPMSFNGTICIPSCIRAVIKLYCNFVHIWPSFWITNPLGVGSGSYCYWKGDLVLSVSA